MEITTEMVIFVAVFTLGIVIGIYIMTQVNNKQDSKLLTNLLELEDNMTRYKNQLHELTVAKRLAETRLRMYEIKDQQIVEVSKFLASDD
tara:strand:- start:1087 stop:1356 length:270 start_codon:yes stop_codon:yes gene_type:complete